MTILILVCNMPYLFLWNILFFYVDSKTRVCNVLTRNSLDLKMSIFRQFHYKFAIEYPLRVEGKNGTKLHLFLNYLKRILRTLQNFGSVARILPKERINCFVRHVIVFFFLLAEIGVWIFIHSLVPCLFCVLGMCLSVWMWQQQFVFSW